RVLLATAHTLEAPAVAAGAVAHEAAAGGALDELLAAAHPGDSALWIHVAGWSRVDCGHDIVAHEAPVSPELCRQLVRLSDGQGENDLRVAWLGAVLAVHEQPARAASADLPARIIAWLRRRSSAQPGDRPWRARDVDPAPPLVDSRTSHGSGAELEPAKLPPGHTDRGVEDGRSQNDTSRDQSSASATAATRRESGETRALSARPRVNDEALTCYAGLLFLVTVLARLRFGRFLAQRPWLLDHGFPARLLACIGRSAGMTGNDPLAPGLAGCAGNAEQLIDREVPESLFRAWSTAVRRWCARRAEIDWLELICRPGRVRFTRTRIDVSFEPEQAGVALRRLALDVDPGWVPWLGRVIQFHYVPSDERAR
ncbi:MAG: hypothetical protein ACREH8_06940, partial [Opitutaceae bacterium]